MTTTTSNETKSFSDRMQQQLTEVKASVDRTLTDMQAARSKADSSLRSKREAAQTTLVTRRTEVDQANASLKAALEAKKASADAAVAEWKAKRDVERLADRADLAEDYASTAVVLAYGAFEEASAAILDAILARADAEEAKEGVPAKA